MLKILDRGFTAWFFFPPSSKSDNWREGGTVAGAVGESVGASLDRRAGFEKWKRQNSYKVSEVKLDGYPGSRSGRS